jgi:hypothetical protein
VPQNRLDEKSPEYIFCFPGSRIFYLPIQFQGKYEHAYFQKNAGTGKRRHSKKYGNVCGFGLQFPEEQ